MLFIRLFCKLSRVLLDSLEAQLRPVEQPDKDWVPIIMDVLLTKLKVLYQPQLAFLLIALLNSQNNRPTN